MVWPFFRQQYFPWYYFSWVYGRIPVVLPFPEMKPFWLHFYIKLFISGDFFFFKKTEFLCESFLWQLLGMKGLTRLLTLRLQGTEWTLDQLKNLTRNFVHTKFFKINVQFTRKWWTTSNFNLSQWVFTMALASPRWVTTQLMQPRLCRPKFFDRTGKQCDLLFGVHFYERLLRRVKIVQSGVDAAWDGFYQAVNRPRQPHSQVRSPTRFSLSLSLCRYVGTGRREPWGRGCRPLPISANPGFNYNQGFLFFCLKASSRINFPTIFRVYNRQIVDKKG